MKKVILFSFFSILFFHISPISSSDSFCENALLFSGNANRELAEKVATYLGAPLADAKVSRFSDGEVQICVNENVRNKEVFIVQSVCSTKDQTVNDSLIELFLMIRTMKRASAGCITAVVPYYGYARQDRKTQPRVPISASDIAIMLEMAGADRVITVDLHCQQIQGFFQNAPVDNLFAAPLLADYFSKKNLQNVVVVSPDVGGVDRAQKFHEYLNEYGIPSTISLISKRRSGPGQIESMILIGDVTNADAIIIDDMCDTAGTLVKAAKLIKDLGANRVFAAVTHPIFSGTALDTIKNSPIEEMIITDTIPLKEAAPDNLHCLSISALLGEAIYRIHNGKSLSELFQHRNKKP